MMSTLEPVHGLAPSHPSLTGASYSPNLAPPNLSSMSRGMASGRSSPFSSSESVQYTPSPSGPDLNLGLPSSSPFDGGLAPQVRHRPSRSEDLGRQSPLHFAAAQQQLLNPTTAYSQVASTQYGYIPPIRSQDPFSVGIPSSVGPARLGRRGSGSVHHDRQASLGSSVRPSPYPSPSGSPALVAQGLPPMNDHTMNPWSKVERQQVTTPATAKASEGRRKGEASFVCPVPGCGSTFTRHFNLKGNYARLATAINSLFTSRIERSSAVSQRGATIQVQVAWLREGFRSPARLQAARGLAPQLAPLHVRWLQEDVCPHGRAEPPS
jgi:hypothetical protein